MRYRLVLAALAYLSLGAGGSVLPLPEAAVHSGFLLSEYDPAKPSVAVFKDPLCGYCLAAMPQLNQLSAYNVYLFWAPIFGQRSELSINEIFRCANPVDKLVRDRVAARQTPGCAREIDNEALAVNQNMVDAYRINSVPAYYFQGKRVSLRELLLRQLEHPRVSGVAVNWDRYNDARVRTRPESHSIALLLHASDGERLLALDEQYLPQFVFTESDRSMQKSYKELRLLLGLDGRQQNSFLVSRDGQIHEL